MLPEDPAHSMLRDRNTEIAALKERVTKLSHQVETRGRALLECVRTLHERDEHFNSDWMACDRPLCAMVRESLKWRHDMKPEEARALIEKFCWEPSKPQEAVENVTRLLSLDERQAIQFLLSAPESTKHDWVAQETVKVCAKCSKRISTIRSCNRHNDCDKANAQAVAEGRGRPTHCHDDDCEDCFGK